MKYLSINFLTSCLALFLIVATFTSCKKKEDTASPSVRSRFVDAHFNGKAFKSIFTDTGHTDVDLLLFGTDNLTTAILSFPLNGITLGSHDLDISNDYGIIYMNDDLNGLYLPSNCQMQITRNDSKLEGTFEGVLKDISNPDDCVVVTNGQFSYNY